MLKKSYSKSGAVCRATFKLPAEVDAEGAMLLGDFNNWNDSQHPMKRLKDGSFSITVSLETERSYRFRYMLDGERWENDWAADEYLPNAFGTDDSIIHV